MPLLGNTVTQQLEAASEETMQCQVNQIEIYFLTKQEIEVDQQAAAASQIVARD